MQYKDYYKVLGVDKNAGEKEIKRTYRKLARQYHPDHNHDNKAAEEKFKEINEAYEVVGNTDNRAKYDQLGSNYHQWKQMGGNTNPNDFSRWAGGGRQQNINVDDLFGGAPGGNFSEFFSSMFGQQAGAPGFHTQPLRQKNSEQPIEITLEEAFNGTSRTLVGPDGDRITAKIPKGAQDGTKVRLRGKGQQGGDLYLVVGIRPNANFERKGDDLHTKIVVDVLTAVLGGTIEIKTFKGIKPVKITPGMQGGRKLRFKGHGMPNLRSKDTYGALYLQVQIEVPTELTDDERHLYQQLADLKD